MGRRKDRGGGDYSKEQRLRHEIKKLKRQNQALRKQLARVDLDRYTNIKDLIEKYDRMETDEARRDTEAKLNKKWECWECRQGVLMMVPLFRRDGQYYFRRCRNCGHRTKTQPMKQAVDKGPEGED